MTNQTKLNQLKLNRITENPRFKQLCEKNKVDPAHLMRLLFQDLRIDPALIPDSLSTGREPSEQVIVEPSLTGTTQAISESKEEILYKMRSCARMVESKTKELRFYVDTYGDLVENSSIEDADRYEEAMRKVAPIGDDFIALEQKPKVSFSFSDYIYIPKSLYNLLDVREEKLQVGEEDAESDADMSAGVSVDDLGSFDEVVDVDVAMSVDVAAGTGKTSEFVYKADVNCMLCGLNILDVDAPSWVYDAYVGAEACQDFTLKNDGRTLVKSKFLYDDRFLQTLSQMSARGVKESVGMIPYLPHVLYYQSGTLPTLNFQFCTWGSDVVYCCRHNTDRYYKLEKPQFIEFFEGKKTLSYQGRDYVLEMVVVCDVYFYRLTCAGDDDLLIKHRLKGMHINRSDVRELTGIQMVHDGLKNTLSYGGIRTLETEKNPLRFKLEVEVDASLANEVIYRTISGGYFVPAVESVAVCAGFRRCVLMIRVPPYLSRRRKIAWRRKIGDTNKRYM